MSAAAAAIAAHGLPSGHDLRTVGLDDDEFERILHECESHRLLGLFARAVRDGALSLSDEHVDRLEELFRGWLTHAVRVERMLLDATAALDRAGIDSRVLKGVALSHTAYSDPSERVFGDVDLLVPGDRLRRSTDVLADAFGVQPAPPELRPGFDDRFGKEAMLKVHALELDVHRTFVEGAFGLTVELGDLFAPPYRFPLGGMEMDALPQPQRLLHACYAAALGDWPPRLISLRDVAQLIITERPHIVDVLLMARRWQAEAVVSRAVVTAWNDLALTCRSPIVDWAFNFCPSRRERMLLAAHEGPARAFTRHAASLVVLPGVRDRVVYLRAIAMPQRSYLEARGMTPASHVRRVWDRMVR